MLTEIDLEKIKFTNMSVDELVLSLDRLTRFKYPEQRYYRVFSDIICKHLIEPKLSKNNLESLGYSILAGIAEKIWNKSSMILDQKYFDKKRNDRINTVLREDINQTYNISEDVKSLISVNLDVVDLLKYLKNNDDIPINLKRLTYIDEYYESKLCRERYSLKYPVEKVVLCEGITEEILLPKFAKLYGYDFDKYGVNLISAGGKNQVAKMYVKLKKELNIPIFILLDADAKETEEIISPVLRASDELYLIHHGEFEDIFSLSLIKRTINKRYKNICECIISDFRKSTPMTKTLTDFYRIHKLGDFQKADFAKEISENLKYKTDLTEELIEILKKIKNFS